jgi:hypothetical protein
VVRSAFDLFREQPARRVVTALVQRRHALAEIAERRVRVEFGKASRERVGLGAAAEIAQREHAVGHRVQVVRLAFGDAPQRLLGPFRVVPRAVDHAQGHVGAQQFGVGAKRLAGEPVSIVDPALRQRLDRAVVQVHRDHGALGDLARVEDLRVARRQEVDDHRRLDERDAATQLVVFEHQVHVADRDVQVARPVPDVFAENGLVVHRQPEFLREGRRHQHQRETVARARVERLRRGARARGVVLELEVAVVQRVDQLAAAVAELRARDRPGRQILAHRRAHRQRRARVDVRRRRFEEFVVEECRCGWHRGPARAGSKQRAKQQGGQVLHRASSWRAEPRDLGHDGVAARLPGSHRSADQASRCFWNTSPACSRSAWNRIFGQFASMARNSGAYSTRTVGASTAS